MTAQMNLVDLSQVYQPYYRFAGQQRAESDDNLLSSNIFRND